MLPRYVNGTVSVYWSILGSSIDPQYCESLSPEQLKAIYDRIQDLVMAALPQAPVDADGAIVWLEADSGKIHIIDGIEAGNLDELRDEIPAFQDVEAS